MGTSDYAAAGPGAAGASPSGPFLSKSDILRRNNVRLMGQGPRTLVLCNGFGYNQRLWHHLAPALAAQHRVVLFDHVGSGESNRQAYDPQKYDSLQGYAHDLIEICAALELREAVLIGHSVGAIIALLAASAAPRYFGRVVLLTPSPCYVNEPGYYGGFERENLQQVLESMQADYHRWAYQFADLIMGDANSPVLSEELGQHFGQADAAIAQQFARVTFFSDNRPDVPRLHLPTLVVLCREDVVAPAEVGHYLLAHLPQARLVTLRTTGHCPHLSAPLETLAAIQSFIS
ncbi:MAG TPA: alpha/beta hydrolase [Hymenobacter sp.]|uniref:alpha/beta fold hydrolase n=1 Tax=Hymenobacter sp. TaxID=1898978 RepID=UPI002D8053EA|nr:alpha/beta hydrolase [Hymenobacter sp.]HET9505811.1 alpha/beta hydrolase [Hymenobacter sp.]